MNTHASDMYKYTGDLMAIAASGEYAEQKSALCKDSSTSQIVTQLRVSEWEKLLLNHPEKQFVAYTSSMA